MSAKDRSGLGWLPLTVLVIGLDAWTKTLIVHHFKPFETLTLLPVLDLTLRYNTGAAFSFLAGASGWQRWAFIALAFVVGAGILFWLKQLSARRQWLLSMSLALILAGALGNVIDRLRIGHVVDFIVAHWHTAEFPAFNVADSAITVGAALLLLDSWLESRRKKALA